MSETAQDFASDAEALAAGYRFKIVGNPDLPVETTSWAPDEEVRDEVVAHYRDWLDLDPSGMVVTDLQATKGGDQPPTA